MKTQGHQEVVKRLADDLTLGAPGFLGEPFQEPAQGLIESKRDDVLHAKTMGRVPLKLSSKELDRGRVFDSGRPEELNLRNLKMYYL